MGYGLNGWGIYGSNGLGSYGKVSYCFLGIYAQKQETYKLSELKFSILEKMKGIID